MTENEKRYEDFIRALKELCRSHGVSVEESLYDNLYICEFDPSDPQMTAVDNSFLNFLDE